MNTISFREAIKLVHPDINKNVIDASYKITTIKVYRNDEKYLYTLLSKWGDLKTKNSNFKTFKNTKNYSTTIRINSEIFVKTKGIVVKVVKITRKRYYFINNGVMSFCNKSNAIKYFKV